MFVEERSSLHEEAKQHQESRQTELKDFAAELKEGQEEDNPADEQMKKKLDERVSIAQQEKSKSRQCVSSWRNFTSLQKGAHDPIQWWRFAWAVLSNLIWCFDDILANRKGEHGHSTTKFVDVLFLVFHYSHNMLTLAG